MPAVILFSLLVASRPRRRLRQGRDRSAADAAVESVHARRSRLGRLRLRLGRRRRRHRRRPADVRHDAPSLCARVRLRPDDAQRPREDRHADRRLPHRLVDQRRRRHVRRQQVGRDRAGAVGDARCTYKFHITYDNGAADGVPARFRRTRRKSTTASAARTRSSAAPPATRGPAPRRRSRAPARRWRRLVRLARRGHVLGLRRSLRRRRPSQRRAAQRSPSSRHRRPTGRAATGRACSRRSTTATSTSLGVNTLWITVPDRQRRVGRATAPTATPSVHRATTATGRAT